MVGLMVVPPDVFSHRDELHVLPFYPLFGLSHPARRARRCARGDPTAYAPIRRVQPETKGPRSRVQLGIEHRGHLAAPHAALGRVGLTGVTWRETLAGPSPALPLDRR